MDGAALQGIAVELSGPIFDLMEKFAGYGFNKSHSAAYALLSYQTAWLKLHYPAEFMAAVLSAEMHDTEALVPLIDDCRAWGLKILAPQINRSEYGFIPESAQTILYGLGAIKGMGQGPVDSIIAERQANGAFVDILDFASRLDSAKITRRSLEALIRAGCFDGMGGHRQTLLNRLEEVLATASRTQRNLSLGIEDLFASTMTPAEILPDLHTDVRPLSSGTRLQMELEALGLFLSGHPLDVLHSELQQSGCTPLSQVKPGSGYREKDKVAKIAGRLVTWRLDKSGRAQVLLEDAEGRMEIILAAEMLTPCKDLLETGRILIAEGPVRLDRFRNAPTMQVTHLMDLDQLRQRRARCIRIYIRPGKYTLEATALKALIDEKHAELAVDLAARPLYIHLCLDKNGTMASEQVELIPGTTMQLSTKAVCIDAIRNLVGDDALEIVYD